MGSNKITTSYTPINADDLTRKGYVDTQLALKANTSALSAYLPLSGGTITGELLVLNNPIITSTNSNVTENIRFVASADHFSSSAAQSYLFQGVQGQIIVANSVNRLATEANLMMGVDSSVTFARISSVKSNGASGFLPLQYNASLHSFFGEVALDTLTSRFCTLNTGRTAPSAEVVLTLQDNEANPHKLWFVPNVISGNYNSNVGTGDFGIFTNFGNSPTGSNAIALGPWNGSNLVRITPTNTIFYGNVGIGTGAPNAPLHIQSINRLVTLTNTTTSTNYIEFNTNNGAGLMYVGMDNNAGIGLFGSGDAYGACLGAASATSLNLATNNLIRLKIGSDGNVTVGSLTYAQLQANFTVYRGGNASMAVVSGGENSSSTLFFGTPFDANSAVNNAYKSAIIAHPSGVGWSRNNLHFCINGVANNSPANTATIADSKMVINYLGNVGIGTDPLSRLDISRTARTGSHGSGVGLYVTNDTTMAEFRHSNGTQGIGIGFNEIFATGSNTNTDLNLTAKGVGAMFFRAGGTYFFKNDNPVVLTLDNNSYSTNDLNALNFNHGGGTSTAQIQSRLTSATTRDTRLRFTVNQGVFSSLSGWTATSRIIMNIDGQFRCVGINGIIESSSQYDATQGVAPLCVGGADAGGNGCIQVTAQPTGFYGGRAQDCISCRAFTNANFIITFHNTAGVLRGQIAGVNASSVAYQTSSDRRLKDHIHPIDDSLGIVSQLKPVHFRWKADDQYDFGFIAQDVYKVLPHLRPNFASYIKDCCCNPNDLWKGDLCDHCKTMNDEPVDEAGKPKYYSLDYGRFTPYLIGAVQEQQTQIETLQARNELLETHARQQEKVFADFRRLTDERIEKLASIVQSLIK